MDNIPFFIPPPKKKDLEPEPLYLEIEDLPPEHVPQEKDKENITIIQVF